MAVRPASPPRMGNSSGTSDTPSRLTEAHAPQSAQGGKRSLHGHRDARLHLSRRRARVGGPHGELGVGEVRQQVHRQAREAHRPQQNHGGVEHAHCDWAVGKDVEKRVWGSGFHCVNRARCHAAAQTAMGSPRRPCMLVACSSVGLLRYVAPAGNSSPPSGGPSGTLGACRARGDQHSMNGARGGLEGRPTGDACELPSVSGRLRKAGVGPSTYLAMLSKLPVGAHAAAPG